MAFLEMKLSLLMLMVIILYGVLTDGRSIRGQLGRQVYDVTRQDGSDTNDLWLEDYERKSEDIVRHFEMQADAPHPGFPGDQAECPPLDLDPSQSHCSETGTLKCSVDADCTGEGVRCCFDPCTKGYACRPVPAVVDWIREPRRKRPGNSWLMEASEADRDYVDNSELCSTTPVDEDADPLLCPHGYFCHIDSPGDPDNDIPNRGRCVADNQKTNVISEGSDRLSGSIDFTSSNDQPLDIREHLPAELLDSGVCIYENSLITEGKTFAYQGLPCKCQEGKIICRVARPEFPVLNFR